MTLTHTFQVGALRCHTLEGGRQRLDGGAMFGVVPKPLWSKRIAPDDRNRIPLAMRCLLIEHPEGLVLVDTAVGNKEDLKFHDIYGIENEGKTGATQLDDALAQAGYYAADVRWVINTHLHFDHAGGNTVVSLGERTLGGSLSAKPTFPNATYIVQRGELDFARHTNERTRASYLAHNFEPIAQAGRWKVVEGDVAVMTGISVRLTPGHVPFHQTIIVRSAGDTVAFVGDLIPTSAHLPLPWIMGFDLEPLRTLESKRSFFRDAVQGGWLVVFEHDPNLVLGRVVAEERGVGLAEVVKVERER